MNQQVNQQLLCVEQQCNFNREISNWNALQDHLKLTHDILIADKFIKEVRQIHSQQVKEEQQKYVNQLNEFLQQQESSFNQQIKSLFQSIKTLCNDHLKSKLVDPQFNYTLQEMLKIYHNQLQLINVKQALDYIFADLKKIFDEAIKNFQNIESKCIQVIFEEQIIQDTPTGLEFKQKEFQQNKNSSNQQIQNASLKSCQQQQIQQDPFYNKNYIDQQDYNNNNFYEEQRNQSDYDYNQSRQEMPLKGYHYLNQQQARINFQMPSENYRNSSYNNMDDQQYFYGPRQNNRSQKQYQHSTSHEKKYSPYNKYRNNNYQRKDQYAEYVQKYQQFPQNNNNFNILGSLNLQDNQNNQQNPQIQQQQQQVIQNNNQQKQIQNYEPQNRMQIQDESAIRFSADSTAIIKSSNSIANLQNIQQPQEVKRKKFDIVNSDKQLKFFNRFTGCFSAFEQDAIVDGMFSVNDDAKVGFIFNEQQGETPFPIIDMGIMEVDQEGIKIKDSKYFIENNEQKTFFVLDEQYWMEYDGKQKTLSFKNKQDIGQIQIKKGYYFKFYVRVCGLNVQIL